METTIDGDVVVDADVAERFGGSIPIDVLEDQICSRSANLTAAEGEWLLLVAEFDRRKGWEPSGHRSCAQWLAWEIGLDVHTAYEKVRVAHALVDFPVFAEAMASGALAYAKARAITRVARADNVDKLLDMALSQSANQVEKVVAAMRRSEVAAEAAAERAYRERSMSWRIDGATAVISLRMPVDMAAELNGMIGEFMDLSDLTMSEVARRVDALMSIAEFATVARRMGIDPTTTDPRYLANLHLTPDVFDDDKPEPAEHRQGQEHATGHAAHEHGSGGAGGSGGGGGVCCVQPGGKSPIHPASVSRSTARRILCDAALQGFRTNESGEAEIGTTTPTVSRKLKRALLLRDGGCRFPGCTMAAWVDAHHIRHWIDLGPTRPQNLICLCRRHHRLMHEGHWNITGDPAGEVFFHRPDGTVIAAQPARRTGVPAMVDAFGLTALHGRCGWTVKRCNYNAIADMILDTERARRRSRRCKREAEPVCAESP